MCIGEQRWRELNRQCPKASGELVKLAIQKRLAREELTKEDVNGILAMHLITEVPTTALRLTPEEEAIAVSDFMAKSGFVGQRSFAGC